MKDYYKILGVEKSDSIITIKRVFRKLALEFHPDVSKAPDAHEKFIELNEAYQVLGNPLKRKRYDQLYNVQILNKKPKRERAYNKKHESWEANMNRTAEKGKARGKKYASQSRKKYERKSSSWTSNILFDIFTEIVWSLVSSIFDG